MINFEGLVKRLMQVGGLAALIMIVFSFSARIAEYTRLNAQQGIESTRIAELIATTPRYDKKSTIRIALLSQKHKTK